MSSFEERRAALWKQKAEQEQQLMQSFRQWVAEHYPQAQEEPNGCFVEILQEGQGKELPAGQQVSVNYTGFFPDKKEFVSSRRRNSPFSFRLGGGRVIRCWDENLQGKAIGTRLLLIAPYTLAYGENGSPPVIPPKATLLFDVELLSAG